MEISNQSLDLERLEAAFEKALILQLKAAQKNARYNPKFVLKLIAECGHLEAARQMLAGGASMVNTEFTKLWEKDMLKFSVEAMICGARWQPLFTEEEIEVAKARLEAYGYYTKNAAPAPSAPVASEKPQTSFSSREFAPF